MYVYTAVLHQVYTGLTLCVNRVVPRVLPLVLRGLLVARVATSVSKLRHSTRLEPGCKHWWGYLPSSTREGGLLIGLLAAGMPASSALSDACGRVTVYWGLSVFTGTISQFWLYLYSVFCIFYLLPSGCSSPFHCRHTT